DLLEDAFKNLLKTECRSAVEFFLVGELEKGDAPLVPAAAQLIVRLQFFTPRLFQALQRSVPLDSSDWDVPIHRALRVAVTPDLEKREPPVLPGYGCLPFKDALLTDPRLVDRIRSESDWLRVVIALYGGLGDYSTAHNIAEYHSISGFLQQED